MKKFGVIFQYEIMNYIKNKSFMISTIVIAVLAAVILFLPSVFDMSGILGINKDDTDDTADNTEITDVIIICDEKDIFAGTGIVEGVLNDVKIENVSSRDALVDKIENDENVIAGFVVKNATDFEYVVNNSDMFDDMTQRFTYAMQLLSQYNYCKENNLETPSKPTWIMVHMIGESSEGFQNRFRSRMFDLDGVVYGSYQIDRDWELSNTEAFQEMKASEFWKIVESAKERSEE